MTRFLQKFDQLRKLSLGGELGGASIIEKYAELPAPTHKRDLYLITFHPCHSVSRAALRVLLAACPDLDSSTESDSNFCLPARLR
jgi:hypothetical protein